MALRRPDDTEILEYSARLGLGLTPTEARVMQSSIAQLLASADAFWKLRIEEQRLPLNYPNRQQGHRPTEEEDPFHLVLWKCHIEGAHDGPLKGKRIGLKDHISVAGVPLAFGSRFMEGYIPDFDATIVTRVLDAGGTIVGKLATDGFSTRGLGGGAPGDFGRPLNPHNPAHLTGGSSSGSAGAVAAGMVDIAFGGDQGGSIRIPAAWCGVIGLKATFGLIPHTGVFGRDPVIDYVGPLTRTVEELATVLECVAGADGYDARQMQVPEQIPAYTQALNTGVDGLRIGVLQEGFGEDTEPDVEDAVLGAIATLERTGARVEKVSVPLHGKADLAFMPFLYEGWKHTLDTNLSGTFLNTYYPTSLMTTFGRLKQSSGHQLPMSAKMSIIVGSFLEHLCHGALYAKAHNVRPTFIRAYDEVFARVDILAMPTVPVKAPLYQEPADYEEALSRSFVGRLSHEAGNTLPFNLTGHPAMSIPCGKSGGLPIGLQLVAPYFREDQLIRAAHAYQCSVDWASLLANPLLGRDERVEDGDLKGPPSA